MFKFNQFFTLMLSFSLLSFSLNAQTWTATDWQGNSHDISTHINAGQAVLVDISAHWCSPCWSWHTTHIMEDLYHDFGPEGTNEFMVFFLDASPQPQSNNDLLLGGTGSQGDWTEGTTYPIIGPNGQGVAVANNYSFPGYPTLFLHCGEGQAPEIERNATKWGFWADVMSMCPSAFESETVDATLIKVADDPLCVYNGFADIGLEVYNAGTETLTSFDLEVKDADGNVVTTENLTGQSVSHGDATIIPVSIPFVEGEIYTATVSNPNGMADPRPNGDTEEFTVTSIEGYDTEIKIEVKPDQYGSEVTWNLMDDEGAVLASGGPYSDGAAASQPVDEVTVTVPSIGCYTFEIKDGYGDGICCAYGEGYYRVTSGTDVLAEGGEYGSGELTPFGINHPVNVQDPVLQQSLELFPNPTTAASTLTFDAKDANQVTVNVYNTIGEVVYQSNLGKVSGSQSLNIPSNDWATGIYFVEIQADGKIASQRLSVVK